MNPCPTRGQLEQYLEDGLPAVEAASIESHVEACGFCQRTLDLITRAALPSEVDESLRRTPSPLEPKPILPDIELLKVIGRGGAGRVWKGRLRQAGQVVAVKVLTGGAFADPRQQEGFLREIHVLARLSHPNLIRLYHAGPTADGYYFSMEFFPAGSLADERGRHRDRPWPVRRAAEVVAAAARGVHHAHTQGVVHRDLKPGNILLAADSRPVVADFGLARETGHVTTGAPAGTPCYMAPEQATGRASGPRTDVYGLGAVLYDLLTGRPPVPPAGSDLETLELVKTAPVVPPRHLRPEVPADLELVCLKCLEKGPNDRYPSAAAAADDLDRFLAGQPVVARRRSWAERIGRWTVKRRRWLAAAGAVLITGLLTACLTTWRGYERERVAREELESREKTLRELLSEVNKTEAVFRNLPQGQAEHRRLVRALKEVVCRWADEPSATAEARREAVAACLRLAQVELNAGSYTAGTEAVDEAIRRTEALRAADGGSVATRYLLARGLQYRARAAANAPSPSPDAALADAEAALSLFTALANEDPTNADYRNPVSHLALTAAQVHRDRGQYASGVAVLRRGLEADRWLQREFPDGHPQSYIRLAVTLEELGRGLALEGDAAGAEDAFREAVRQDDVLREPRFANPPTNRQYTIHCRVTLTGFLIGRGRDEEARPLLERVAKDVDALAEAMPDNRLFAEYAWVPHFQLGQIEYLAGQDVAAKEAFGRALARATRERGVSESDCEWCRLRIPYPTLRDLSDSPAPSTRLRCLYLAAASPAFRGEGKPSPAVDEPQWRAATEYLKAIIAINAGDKEESAARRATAERLAATAVPTDGELRVLAKRLESASEKGTK